MNMHIYVQTYHRNTERRARLAKQKWWESEKIIYLCKHYMNPFMWIIFLSLHKAHMRPRSKHCSRNDRKAGVSDLKPHSVTFHSLWLSSSCCFPVYTHRQGIYFEHQFHRLTVTDNPNIPPCSLCKTQCWMQLVGMIIFSGIMTQKLKSRSRTREEWRRVSWILSSGGICFTNIFF